MAVTLKNADGLAKPVGFSHIARAPQGELVFLSGQPGADADGILVAGGLAAQTTQALLNVSTLLEAAGATEQDLVKLTLYVAGWEISKREELFRGFVAARQHRPFPDVPLTLVGVEKLFEQDMLIEVEGIAVLAT